MRCADDAARDAQRAHCGELGTLRLRFVQSTTFEALPRLLAAFRPRTRWSPSTWTP